MAQSAVILMLLGASLVALLLVMFARKEADAVRHEAAEIRDEARSLLTDAQRRDERVAAREKELSNDQRHAAEYARGLEDRVAAIARDEAKVRAEREAIAGALEAELASVAGMSAKDALKTLTASLEKAAEQAAAGTIRRVEKRVKAESEIKAREVLVSAMQRLSGTSSANSAVTWVTLPSEEMKGRIIGREGRNIRAFEAITGVNVIVEEGVNAVQLSSFDVERREIALVTLNTLVEDGRIHPQRVESAYAAAVEGTQARHIEAGLDAIESAGIGTVPERMVELLGRLRLRSSFGQSVLAHLVESAHLAAEVAVLVGADAAVARRGAFLHDIGKAFTHEREGSHASLGAELAKELGESEVVVNAIAAHHDEVKPASLEAVIVQIADALSASRPGARRDDLEGYVERMGNIEKLVAGHAGVTKAVVMSAGHEVRVVVEPDEVDDKGAAELARTIAKRIETDLTFPGEIKVTVIREVRAEAVAG